MVQEMKRAKEGDDMGVILGAVVEVFKGIETRHHSLTIAISRNPHRDCLGGDLRGDKRNVLLPIYTALFTLFNDKKTSTNE